MVAEKEMKFKIKEADKFYQRGLKKKAAAGWIGVYTLERK
jgi:hypothetical protein